MSIQSRHKLKSSSSMLVESMRGGASQVVVPNMILVHQRIMQKCKNIYMEGLCKSSPYLHCLRETRMGFAEHKHIRIYHPPTSDELYIGFIYSNSSNWDNPSCNKFYNIIRETNTNQPCNIIVNITSEMFETIELMRDYIRLGEEIRDSGVWLMFYYDAVHPVEHLFEKYRRVTERLGAMQKLTGCTQYLSDLPKWMKDMRILFDQGLDMNHEFTLFCQDGRHKEEEIVPKDD
eukprot:Seg11125.2 transcript_id=Seg11125.2/GoldUCD/mRNA.D3Y31 product="hypothetical protein" protein_id=Seg11125.2/GoldUCD/D3Y31